MASQAPSAAAPNRRRLNSRQRRELRYKVERVRALIAERDAMRGYVLVAAAQVAYRVEKSTPRRRAEQAVREERLP